MLNPVPVPPKSLSDYAAVVGAQTVARLRDRAEQFKGARVLHISSTAFGGGVPELLYTLVPLMRDLGFVVEWRLLEGHEAFYTVTKAMHNALQGAEIAWTEQMRTLYREVNEDNAARIRGEYDFVVVHDPQPAALPAALLDAGVRPKGKWIWRCHIDLTERFNPVWDFLNALTARYDAAVFTLDEYVPPDALVPHAAIIAPSIDPLSLKNVAMDSEMVTEVIHRYGIDPLRPLLVQVSRFDPWKDPTGAIDAYRLAKKDFPGLQLALLASMVHDDAESWHYFNRAEEHRADDPDIWLLSNLQEVGALAVNAFQRAADVIIQKSRREGFGLVVAEGMWKRKPVIGGNVGGIKLQITDGETGFLVDSVEECAERIVEIMRDPQRAASIGAAARARVRERFLATRELEDWLSLFEKLSAR